MRFSIIIPVHNGEKTIERLLGSLIIQRHAIHEVLVCNDHSSDKTVDVVRQYKNLLPILVLNVPDEIGYSPGNARQYGLDYATGDWAVFADADDILTFNAIGYYKKAIEANDKARIICGAFDEVNFDPFFVIEHMSSPLAWVHAKAFNINHIREHGLRFHPTLYTHEDKYFTMLNLLDIRLSGFEPVMQDVTTYYWCRSEGTIVSRDNGKYPILSLVDSMDAIIEPVRLLSEKYGLNRDQVIANVGEGLFQSVIEAYYKFQGAVFKWGDSILEENNLAERVMERISKVREMTGWTNQDIVDLCYENVKVFNDMKGDTVRTIGEFVPYQTIHEFLNV